ncbi:MAG: cytochrome c-type bioproteinis protein [Parcubacteria group bacterium Greene0714_7]|nr:MAG: cytochrome c-type bioproteinis protein [Parcubacteria group bacterium Greene0714_7]
MLGLLIPSFFAGLLTFFAPCTLPMVPGYLGFISGVSTAEERGRHRGKIFWNGVSFIFGFSLVFIVLGTVAGLLGAAFAPYQIWISRAAGVLVVLFGLSMIGFLKIPILNKEHHMKAPQFFKRGNPLGSFLFGGAFSLGWTPCVGPILGSILLLASTGTTALQGALLLSVFSLGLAVPFLIIAFSVNSAEKYLVKMTPYLNAVTVIGGVFLIALGVLLLTNKMPVFLAWTYGALEFLHYDKLLEHL